MLPNLAQPAQICLAPCCTARSDESELRQGRCRLMSRLVGPIEVNGASCGGATLIWRPTMRSHTSRRVFTGQGSWFAQRCAHLGLATVGCSPRPSANFSHIVEQAVADTRFVAVKQPHHSYDHPTFSNRNLINPVSIILIDFWEATRPVLLRLRLPKRLSIRYVKLDTPRPSVSRPLSLRANLPTTWSETKIASDLEHDI